MLHALPLRPFIRAKGALDSVVAVSAVPHIKNEITAGVPVHVSGWLVDDRREAVEQAWIDVAGIAVPLELNRARSDVASVVAALDRTGSRFGFEAVTRLPSHLAPGIYDAYVVGLTRRGSGVYGENPCRISVANQRSLAKVQNRAKTEVCSRIAIRDTQLIARTLGRGAHTIREEASLHVTGFVEHARRIHVSARSQSGERFAWEFSCESDGTFDAALWTGGMGRGLYDLLIGRDDADTVTAAAACKLEIAGRHLVQPSHLTKMRSAPVFELITYEDAGVTYMPRRSCGLTAGRPIAVSGWCLDPASGTPPLSVCAEVDGQRPIPLSSRLPNPRAQGGRELLMSGFGGIIDTERLEPGEHEINLLAAAVSGAGWYVIDSRCVTLLDHRSQAPLSEATSTRA